MSTDTADLNRRAAKVAPLLRDTEDRVSRALRASSVLPHRHAG